MRYLLTLFAAIALPLIAAQAMAQSNYRLKPGDTLTVEVLEDSQLNRSLLVLPDGTVTVPFAGQIPVSGRSVGEIQAAITRAIAPNFANAPTVFVSVAQLRPVVRGTARAASVPAKPATINIYVTGEVAAPGRKPVAPGTTFLQAMAQSGGFSNFAATKRVQLRRTNPATGAQKVYTINYRALSRGAGSAKAIFLQEGDVILVPERRLFE